MVPEPLTREEIEARLKEHRECEGCYIKMTHCIKSRCHSPWPCEQSRILSMALDGLDARENAARLRSEIEAAVWSEREAMRALVELFAPDVAKRIAARALATEEETE